MPVEFDDSGRRRARRADVLLEGAVHRGSRSPRSLELRPGNRAVVHHAGVFVVDIPEGATIVERPPGRRRTARRRPIAAKGSPGAPTRRRCPGANKLLSWVPGRGVDSHRADVGKRIPAGKYINWQMHYNPTGKPEKDRTRLGIWFNKVPVTHEVLIRQAGDPLATTKGGLSLYRAEGKEVEYTADEGSTRRRSKTPNIPPYAENWSLTGITPVTEDITLYAMSPHMHLRGKSLQWVIVYPDGREQTILDVPKFDFNWQIQLRARRAAAHSGRQQDPRHRRRTTTRRRTSGTRRRTSRCTGRSRAGTRCTSRSPSTRSTARSSAT